MVDFTAKMEKGARKVSKAAGKGTEKAGMGRSRLGVSLPDVNIGLVGHVDHGKTTLTEALTGEWTDTHSEELKRGITIRLGYADASFYKCPKCKGAMCYGNTDKCVKCFSKCRPLRTVSFVDAPGHETLMATVLAGAALMDGALLIVAANEKCPQPQTREHLTALNIAGIAKVVVVQNKIDLVSREEAVKNHREIKDFLKGTVAEKAPIIPVSAQQGINLDALIQAVEEKIPTPKRDLKKPPKMLVARSFDINRPGTQIEKLRGGALGGSLVQGKLTAGTQVEIRPGIMVDGKLEPVKSKITSMERAKQSVKEAVPGGLLGVSTNLDPYFTKSDKLSGSVLGRPGELPPVHDTVKLKLTLLERVVGAKEELKVEPVKPGDVLMLTVGTARTVGSVTSAAQETTELKLKLPICAEKGERVALSRRIAERWRLIGWGELL